MNENGSATDVRELYEELKASSAREIEALLSEIQSLEDRILHEQGDPDVSNPHIEGLRRLEHRLWRMRTRLATVPVAGRSVRTLKILRRDWRNL